MEKSILNDGLTHAMKVVLLCEPKQGFPKDFPWTKANFVSYKRRDLVTCPKCREEIDKIFPPGSEVRKKRKERWLKKKAARTTKPKKVAPVKKERAQRVGSTTLLTHKKEWCAPVLPIPVFSELRTMSIHGKSNSNADPVPSPEPFPTPITKSEEPTPPVQKIFTSRKQYFEVDVSPGASPSEKNWWR